MKEEEQKINHNYQRFLEKKGLGELSFNTLKRSLENYEPKNTWQRIEHLKNVSRFYYNPFFSKYDSLDALKTLEYLISEPEIISIQLQLKYLSELTIRNSIMNEGILVGNTITSILVKTQLEYDDLDLESKCYYLFLESQDNPTKIEAFENASSDYFEAFPNSNESKIFYVLMLNYNISKIHISEKRKAIYSTFNWYLLGLKYGFIINHKKIQATHFINLLGLATEINQVEILHMALNKILGDEVSILSHIDNLSNKENEKLMEETRIVCKVYLDFHNKDFESCRILYGKSFRHWNIALLAYRQLIKVNMEIWLKNDVDILVLKSSMNAFKKYLHRNLNRISERHFSLNNNFLKTLRTILLDRDKLDFRKLKVEISKTPYIASKWWLVDKIDELKNKL